MTEIRNYNCDSDTDKSSVKIFNYYKKANDEYTHKQVQGSPELRRNYVYPTQSTPIPAFQAPSHPSPKSFPLQELKGIPKSSPLSIRGIRSQDAPPVPSDTEESVNKIRAMFPTVSDTHIKLLLKKYHGREVVVISALQVEKYPITTPGPFPTPPPTHAHASLQMTSPLSFRGMAYRTDSPKPSSGCSNGSPCYRYSPRPHSSPKLKLRYMKSIFPQPDETVILDVLTSNDNDIQKTSEALKKMGYDKKDATKTAKAKVKEGVERAEKEEAKVPAVAVPKIKTSEEKERITAEMKQKYGETPDHLITIALESVNYDEKRADQILKIITQEEQEKIEKRSIQQPKIEQRVEAPAVPVSQSRQSLKSILKSEKVEVHNFSRYVDGMEASGYKSAFLQNTKGANPELSKGPNHKHLLTDYIKCQGPNPGLRRGSQGLAKGPNSDNLLEKKLRARGPNADLRKGPKSGLAKGSIFAQFKGFVGGESRGK